MQVTVPSPGAAVGITDWQPQPVIDCEIHNELPTLKALYPYLPEHWVDYCNESAFVGPDSNDYPKAMPLTVRPDAEQGEGVPPASTVEQIQRDVLDPWQVEVGILTPIYWVSSVHNEDLAAALATAFNHWQVEHWLNLEPRLRASIVIPSQNPSLAAQEIERWADHPGFVQAIVPVRSAALYGNRRYDPIFHALTRHNLALAIHAGGAPGHASTPVGWPSTFAEEYAGMAQIFQSQLLSLVSEGAFDRFPKLRVALLESGFTWLPSLFWRFDKEWKGLRHNTPWVKQLPSNYIRQHVRVSIQPADAPPSPEILRQILAQMESDDLLMFATDYPHWQFNDPAEALPLTLPANTLAKIMAGNARTFYNL